MDHILDVVEENGLGAIINFHNYYDLMEDPRDEKENFYKMWESIAERYKDRPDSLVFEILNEPTDSLNANIDWMPIQNECIRIIRETNPTRKIIVTGGSAGGKDGLWDLAVPNDPNLIASFHYYTPLEFTHQGAHWDSSFDQYLGTQWLGTDEERNLIDESFAQVRAWSQATGIPVILGEFGTYDKADYDSRVRWTECVRETAEKYGFAWAYWEFCSRFGIYDPETGEYRTELKDAILPATAYADAGAAAGRPTASASINESVIGPVTFE